MKCEIQVNPEEILDQVKVDEDLIDPLANLFVKDPQILGEVFVTLIKKIEESKMALETRINVDKCAINSKDSRIRALENKLKDMGEQDPEEIKRLRRKLLLIKDVVNRHFGSARNASSVVFKSGVAQLDELLKEI